jgi:hypothetical protein
LQLPAGRIVNTGRYRMPLSERIAATDREGWTGKQIGLLIVVRAVTFSDKVELKPLPPDPLHYQITVDRD